MSKNKKKKSKVNYKWILLITIWTFFLAILVGLFSENIMRNFNIIFSFFALIFIVLIGVIFDTVGISVASAREKPFHSMAAQKNQAAKYSLKLIKNAGIVSNFCNDVIGDICGIISGSAGAIIIIKISNIYNISQLTLISIIMSGFVASITVGGKAIGKVLGINYSKDIIYYVGKVVMFFDEKLRLNILDK